MMMWLKKSSELSPQEKSILKPTAVFWALAVFLLLHILTLGVMHGSSPFNTWSGKIAFIGIFVAGPVYVFIRTSKPIGWAFLGLSIFLWTLGFSLLIKFIEVLSGG